MPALSWFMLGSWCLAERGGDPAAKIGKAGARFEVRHFKSAQPFVYL